MGIGTKPLRRYGYSQIGTPAVLERKQLIGKNLTCTATISLNGMEMIQFIYQGGTKNETFEWYFATLVDKMKVKYPEKQLTFILDNLWAHKSSLIMRIVQDDRVQLLLVPSNTPQFSPIENMFGHIKRVLCDLEFKRKEKQKKEKLAFNVLNTMLNMQKYQFEGFFKKTFQNMLYFWFKLDRNSLLEKIRRLQ